MGSCTLCGKSYHYCSSCDEIVEHSFGLCAKCWVENGFDREYNAAREKSDAILEACDDFIHRAIRSIKEDKEPNSGAALSSSSVDRLERRCWRLEALLLEVSVEAELCGLKDISRRIEKVLEENDEQEDGNDT